MTVSSAARREFAPQPVTPAARQTHASNARIVLAKRRFAAFFKQGWSTIEGGTQLEWNPFVEGLCDNLQALFEGWLVANGKGTARQRAAVAAHWKRQGLTQRQGRVLVQNMIVNMPPGTLKSRVLMVFFPAWIWLHAPGASFACSSSNDENVNRDSEMCQALVTSEWYRDTFRVPWTVRGKSPGLKKWSTTASGSRLSRTILSGFIGVHVDFIFVDDPDDPLRVFNEPERRRVHHKWTKAIENRTNHDFRSCRVIAQQRVHAEDLTAYVLAQSTWSKKNLAGWMVFCVPMEAGKAPKEYPKETAFGWQDPRPIPANDNAPREVILPSRYPPDVIADKRRKHGSHGYESLYNQNPEALSGGWISREWFRFFRIQRLDGEPAAPPPRPRPDGCNLKDTTFVLPRDERGKILLDFLTISVDASFGSLNEHTASAVSMIVFGGAGVSRFVFDDVTDLMSFNQTEEKIIELVQKYGARRVLIELKANGPGIIDRLQKAMKASKLIGPNGKPIAVNIIGYDPGRDSKRARARMMMPDIEAGVLFLLEGAHWLEAFLKEVCVFPNAPRDDRVDSLAQAMAHHGAANDALAQARAMSRW